MMAHCPKCHPDLDTKTSTPALCARHTPRLEWGDEGPHCSICYPERDYPEDRAKLHELDPGN